MNYKFLQLKINYNFEKNHKIFFNPKVHTHRIFWTGFNRSFFDKNPFSKYKQNYII